MRGWLFYPFAGNNQHKKRTVASPFLYSLDAAKIYYSFSSKVRQGGKERTTLTVYLTRLGVRDAANNVSPMQWKCNYCSPSTETVIFTTTSVCSAMSS